MDRPQRKVTVRQGDPPPNFRRAPRAMNSGTCGLCQTTFVKGIHRIWRDRDSEQWFHVTCAERAWRTANRT